MWIVRYKLPCWLIESMTWLPRDILLAFYQVFGIKQQTGSFWAGSLEGETQVRCLGPQLWKLVLVILEAGSVYFTVVDNNCDVI